MCLNLNSLFSILNKKNARNHLQMIQNASHFIWREGFVDSFEAETACPHWLCNCARTRVPWQCLFVNSRAPGLSGKGHQSPCSAPSLLSTHNFPLVSRLSWKVRYQVWSALILALGRRPGHTETGSCPLIYLSSCTNEPFLGFAGWSSVWERSSGSSLDLKYNPWIPVKVKVIWSCLTLCDPMD